MEVPERLRVVLRGLAEVIELPGAHRSISGPRFEKLDTVSAFVVEPTATIDRIHPGLEIPVKLPLLPAAAMVPTPAALASATASSIPW